MEKWVTVTGDIEAGERLLEVIDHSSGESLLGGQKGVKCFFTQRKGTHIRGTWSASRAAAGAAAGHRGQQGAKTHIVRSEAGSAGGVGAGWGEAAISAKVKKE